MWRFLPFNWRKPVRREDAPPADAAMIAAARRLGLDARQAERLGHISTAVRTRKDVSVHAFAKYPRHHLRNLEAAGPLRLVDERAAGRPEAVLIAAADFHLLLTTLLGAGTLRYATGEELYYRVVHDGPPSEFALNPPPLPPHSVGDFKAALAARPDKNGPP